MEFLWELAFMIVLSLLLPLIFIKLLSATPNFEANEKVAVIKHDRDQGVKSNSRRWEDTEEEFLRIMWENIELNFETNEKVVSKRDPDEGVKSNSRKWKDTEEESVRIMWENFEPNFQTNEKVAVIKRDCDGIISNSPRWKEEEFVKIMWENSEFRENSTVREPMVPGIVDVGCGWHKKRNSREIYEEKRFFNKIELADSAVDESNQGVEPKERESRAQKIEEDEILQCKRIYEEIDESSRKEEVDKNSGLIDEDDWEGIERTELEKRFGAAVAFVESKRNANNLSNDVKMKLYGYHRIVIQGPCLEPQPMALKFSARAKWNAWRQLGIMNPELAMEQYISLLSESIPDWIADYPHDNAKLAYAEIPASARLTL